MHQFGHQDDDVHGVEALLLVCGGDHEGAGARLLVFALLQHLLQHHPHVDSAVALPEAIGESVVSVGYFSNDQLL